VVRTLYKNLGAEEGDAPPSSTPPSHLRVLGDAWERALHAADAQGFATSGLVAWLNTPRAARAAADAGMALWGPEPATVDVVHDKAFCANVARNHGLLEPELHDSVIVLDPEQTTVDTLVAAALSLQAWNGQHGAIAKPRRGTSGRGRLDLRRGVTARAAERLARRGGVIVEPWLPRIADYSTQWWIDTSGTPHFLGATQATQNFAGLWQGAKMWFDDDGIPAVPGAVGRAVVDRSVIVVAEAARAGYFGPCGVDVFSWRTSAGDVRYRLCELNARMTGGMVAVFLARSAWHSGDVHVGARATYSDGVVVVDGAASQRIGALVDGQAAHGGDVVSGDQRHKIDV
jgi:hypothetical protein